MAVSNGQSAGERARQGTLIIIGGKEERYPEDERTILREVARRVRRGKLVIATLASHQPEGYFDDYQRAFQDLEIGELVELYLHEGAEAWDNEKLKVLDDAAGVFFSGGDQLRITNHINDTGIEAKVRSLYERGGLVAGTSAGAAVMSERMLVTGTSRETHRIGDLRMGAGLGLLPHVIVDQHFAQRGRFGRLLGAVALNPRLLGMGIDENTAAVVEGRHLTVIGSGAVYIVDAGECSYSNVGSAKSEGTLAMHDIIVHVLAQGDRFDLEDRRPSPPEPRSGD